VPPNAAARAPTRSVAPTLHTAVDDHSRLAYTESPEDEKGATAADFWYRAAMFFVFGASLAVDRGVSLAGGGAVADSLASVGGFGAHGAHG
jgi:hypothetical protein